MIRSCDWSMTPLCSSWATAWVNTAGTVPGCGAEGLVETGLVGGAELAAASPVGTATAAVDRAATRPMAGRRQRAVDGR